MTTPSYLAIRGNFVLGYIQNGQIVDGYEPDGDSVRFIADNIAHYHQLKNSYRIKPSRRDNSVQLRFDGIDATELHYGSALQPFGAEARDVLLKQMGFEGITIAPNSTKVQSADVASVPGVILAQEGEANGRPVAIVYTGDQAKQFTDGKYVQVTDQLISTSINAFMLQTGMAYLTLYTSMDVNLRATFRRISAQARAENKGVWAKDLTHEFQLRSLDDIEPPNGQTILPKLFRRSVDYLKDVQKNNFRGNLSDWIIEISKLPSRNENDGVVVTQAVDPMASDKAYADAFAHNSLELHLSDLLDEANDFVIFKPDLLDIVFIEK